MAIQNNQIELPFTQAEKDKLTAITPGAEPNAPTASQAEAEAGLDNFKMMTPLRVSQAIAALAGESGSSVLLDEFVNASGDDLDALTPVCQNADGELEVIDPSSESDISSYLGITTAAILDGAIGTVALGGLLKNVTTSFDINDTLYLSKTGELTSIPPEIGVGGFAAGDYVLKIGKVTLNSENPLQKNIKLEGLPYYQL